VGEGTLSLDSETDLRSSIPPVRFA
jgi:hypothetical protein